MFYTLSVYTFILEECPPSPPEFLSGGFAQANLKHSIVGLSRFAFMWNQPSLWYVEPAISLVRGTSQLSGYFSFHVSFLHCFCPHGYFLFPRFALFLM